MSFPKDAEPLRVFIGEVDPDEHRAPYEVIVEKARLEGLVPAPGYSLSIK